MFYGTQTWNPVLIVAQILTIQCLYYITFGLALWILVGPYISGHLMLGHFFGTQWYGFQSFLGWMEILATVGNAIPTSIVILFVVERAKKCLDFAATVFILHLALACAAVGFPTTAAWWLANVTSFVVVALMSEWLCLRKEMQDIPINTVGSRRAIAELVPLDRSSSASKSLGPGSKSLPGLRPTQGESSFLGRIRATIGSSRVKAVNRDPIALAEEV